MKYSVLTNHLAASQLGYTIATRINKYILGGGETDIVVFCQNPIQPCCSLGFMTSNMADAFNYRGPMIATSLDTAHKLTRFPLAWPKLFLSWDLEWTRIVDHNWNDLAKIYQNPQFHILTRSESHKKVIESCWDLQVKGVVDDFDIEKLNKVVESVCHHENITRENTNKTSGVPMTLLGNSKLIQNMCEENLNNMVSI